MNKIPKEYINMFKDLKNNIRNTIEDSNYIPEYIQNAENSINIIDEVKWGIDLPSTVYINMIMYYNSDKAYNIFFEKFKLHNGYHNFLYDYFIRRCAIVHSCAILSDESIDILKQYIAIYKEYNNGRFNKEAFIKQKIKKLEDFENNNINKNISFIESIYNKEMLKCDQSRLILFNYPYFCNDFSEQDYTQQFYNKTYELYWNLSNEYISKRNNPTDLLNILEVFKLIQFDNEKQEGGFNDFDRFIRHYPSLKNFLKNR